MYLQNVYSMLLILYFRICIVHKYVKLKEHKTKLDFQLKTPPENYFWKIFTTL